MATYLYRIMGAVGLDGGMYEDIEATPSVTWQAAVTVVLSSIATGLGATAWFDMTWRSILVVSAVALLTWAAWAVLMFQIGTRVLPAPETHSDLGELLRTTGFAAAPGFLQAFALLPSIALPAFIASTVWMFAAMVVAVRHALDYSSIARAIAVCALAAGLCVAVAAVLGLLLSRPTA
jgi:hypothetical protein